MTLVRNKIRFVYFILLQVSPEDRKLEVEMAVVVVVNTLKVLVLDLLKVGFSSAHFQEILENDHKIIRSQRRWDGE